MSLINLSRLRREQKKKRDEAQGKECRETCNDWSKINAMIDTPGWKLLLAKINEEFESHNSVFNANADKLQEERGYCNGLKFPLQEIVAYKRRALKAQKTLDTLAKNKE